ncbi:unnamed protein product [Macrosiphum euphorbiae]|uniref:Zinc finger BED domain-containing protein 5 n=1 Tax=Macrosiphum euphorbiae TaxID=13131 RepID=A0AAV0Y232_9HEMI|nr:unnamed protein product [Macrosiphum euphorbiae]
MCHEVGSKHDTLVLHTEIRWLSTGKLLQTFYEVKNELSKLFSTENPDFAAYLNDIFFADIFYHLNCLNESIQGKEENVLTSSDKFKGFLKILQVLKRHVENKSLKMFPLIIDIDPQGDITTQLVLNHLKGLEDSMDQYFPLSQLASMIVCAIFTLLRQNQQMIYLLRKKNRWQKLRRIEHYD